MKKFKVEFTNSENVIGAVFSTYDELTDIEADNAEEVIEIAKEWYIERAREYSGMSYEEAEAEADNMVWSVTEV